MINGESLVPAGQDGTGAAFIYPNDTPHPLQIIQANRALRYQQHKEEQAELQKTLEGMDKNLGTAWTQDIPTLEPMREDLVQAHAYHYKQGKDPNDPRNPDYWNLKNMRDQIRQKYAASKQMETLYNAKTELLDKNPDKYDQSNRELLNMWAQLPFEERLKVPIPELKKAPFNAADYISDFSQHIKDPDMSSKYWSDQGLKQIVEQKTESYTPERQAMYGQQARMNPDYDEWIQSQWDNNVAAGDKDMYKQRAFEINKKLKEKGILAQVDPVDLYSAGKLSASFSNHTKVDTHNMPSDEDGDGSGSGDNDALTMLREYAALDLGAAHMYTDKPQSYNDNEEGKQAAEENGAKVGDRFKMTQQLTGNQIGWVTYTDEDGVPKKVEDIAIAWKNMNGKTYVKSTRSIIEQKQGVRKTSWRPINNMWTEVMIPMLDAKYGASANKEKRKLINAAKKLGVDLTAGEWFPDKLYQESDPLGLNDPDGIR